MQVYVDPWFIPLMSPQSNYHAFWNLTEITAPAHLVALHYRDSDFDRHFNEIVSVKKSANQIIVVESEPTDATRQDFMQYLSDLDEIGVRVFSDTVQSSIANAETCISWFMGPYNLYSRSQSSPWYHWQQQQTQRLVPCQDLFDRSRSADCLLGMTKPHRDIIADLYSKSSQQHLIVFSYFRDDLRLGLWDDNIDISLHRVTAGQCLYLGQKAPISAMLPVDIYNQTYFTVVAETTCNNHYSQFTEKIAKPIIARRPFIVFAGQGYLANLRRLGFQTFHGIVDETYDTIEDLEERMTLAWREVENMCQRDPQQYYPALDSVLTHNQQHFLTTDWIAPLRRALDPFV